MSSNTEEELRKAILAIDTSYDLGDKHTQQFLPPNFYIDRLVSFILHHDSTLKAEYEEKIREAVCQRCGNSKYESTPKELLPSLVGALEFRREQYGWNQRQMAHALGWSDSHYSEFISGKCNMSFQVARKAFEIGVPPVVLLQPKPGTPKKELEQDE